MTDVKELAKLVKFLRKSGITKFEDGGLKIELAPEAPKSNYKRRYNAPVTQDEMIPTDGLTEQELLFYSAGGVPEELKGD